MNNERRAYVQELRKVQQLEHEAELLKKMTLFFTRLYSHPLYFALIKEKDFFEILDEFSFREFDVQRWNDFYTKWKQLTD